MLDLLEEYLSFNEYSKISIETTQNDGYHIKLERNGERCLMYAGGSRNKLENVIKNAINYYNENNREQEV